MTCSLYTDSDKADFHNFILSIEPLNPPNFNSEPLPQPDSPNATDTDEDTSALILSLNDSFAKISNTSLIEPEDTVLRIMNDVIVSLKNGSVVVVVDSELSLPVILNVNLMQENQYLVELLDRSYRVVINRLVFLLFELKIQLFVDNQNQYARNNNFELLSIVNIVSEILSVVVTFVSTYQLSLVVGHQILLSK